MFSYYFFTNFVHPYMNSVHLYFAPKQIFYYEIRPSLFRSLNQFFTEILSIIIVNSYECFDLPP